MTPDELTQLRRHLLGAAHVLTVAIQRAPTPELYAQRLAVLQMVADIERARYDRQAIDIACAIVIQ